MRKIGIISLFGYNNYGNRLQLYAVQKMYESLGFDPEIIKYKQKIPADPLLIRMKVLVSYCLSFPANLKKNVLQKQRIQAFKNHSKIHYRETKKYLDPLKIPTGFHENYSFFSVGSDQIWGWFTHPISDFVFLKFAPVEKRITFSPSFGSSTIDQKYRGIFTHGLQEIKNISVREESGAQIIKDFTNKDATVLCDPTMCLSKKEWLTFATPHKLKPKGKFILTYFLGELPLKVVAVLNIITKDYEIVNLNSLKSPEFYAISPSEWVDYINSASLFLTDSFHGVVFSIVLQTPFVVYSRVGGENMQTRITNILEKFNMEDRFEMEFNNPSFFSGNFSLGSLIINNEKEKAISFLNRSLNI